MRKLCYAVGIGLIMLIFARAATCRDAQVGSPGPFPDLIVQAAVFYRTEKAQLGFCDTEGVVRTGSG
jgi:hypothetical protein